MSRSLPLPPLSVAVSVVVVDRHHHFEQRMMLLKEEALQEEEVPMTMSMSILVEVVVRLFCDDLFPNCSFRKWVALFICLCL